MGRISINYSGFEQQMEKLESHINSFDLSVGNFSLDRCGGPAIDQINTAFSDMDILASSFQSLLDATDTYLHKAQTNINLCEADNTMSSNEGQVK